MRIADNASFYSRLFTFESSGDLIYKNKLKRSKFSGLFNFSADFENLKEFSFEVNSEFFETKFEFLENWQNPTWSDLK